MSAIETFFRHCPSCGRRFEIRIVAKGVVDAEEVERDRPATATTYLPYAAAAKSARLFLPLSTGHPVTAKVPELGETKVVRYEYKCKHCEHEWSEDRTTTREVRPTAGYTGD